jgi:hypothetical protein
MLGAISGGAAILVRYLSPRQAALIAIMTAAVVLAGVGLLERAPYERQHCKPSESA